MRLIHAHERRRDKIDDDEYVGQIDNPPNNVCEAFERVEHLLPLHSNNADILPHHSIHVAPLVALI